MFVKSLLNWHLIRAHLCTLAASVSFTNLWRLPRYALIYGGIPVGLIYSVALVVVSAPSVLLHVSLGQLSQQDVVGVWKAVPLFTGIGYIRLLTSLLYSICTISYLALCVMFSLSTVSNTPYTGDCPEILEEIDIEYEPLNTSSCHNETLLASVKDEPEHYVATSLIVIVLWLLLPFAFYNSMKWLRRIMYIVGPVPIVLGIVVISCIGDIKWSLLIRDNWDSIANPHMLHAAITQALLSTQLATGYLISSGDSIYAHTDVEWSSVAIVVTNLLMGWCGIILWYGIGGEIDITDLKVVVDTLSLTYDKNLPTIWSLVIFSILTLSGIVSMITLLYPLYERVRRIGGQKWRYITTASSILAAVATLSVLAVGQSVFILLEDIFLPFLVTVATCLEVYTFVFVYGCRILIEDVEFLTKRHLSKVWVYGWFISPTIILPITIWWIASWYIDEVDWQKPPWAAGGLIVAGCVFLVIIISFSVASIAKQEQYDIVAKIKSSLRASRYWGPQDPITHYHWLASHEGSSQQVPCASYHQRRLGNSSSDFSIVRRSQDTNNESNEIIIMEKERAKSDSLLFVQRKLHLTELFVHENRRRTKSLDDTVVRL